MDRIYKTIKNFNIKQIRRLIWVISFFNIELEFFMESSDYDKWKKEIAETKNLLLDFKKSHLSYEYKFGEELNLLQAVLLAKYCKPSTIDTICIIANDIKGNISIAKIMWNCDNYIQHQLKEIF